jgi:RNA polymerase sigma-70 factor (ECF subfamily)
VQRHDAKLDFEVSSIAQLITTPASKLARRQQQVQLLEALRQLPVEQQTLLELHYWEDLGIGELAEIFEAEAATIRTRLHRARKALRDRMAVDSDETMDTYVRDAKIAR